MAHSVFWPKKTFFYPIGNTSPISFTQGLAPETPAKILLLGCGDPRSILYTVHTELELDTAPRRPLDFTCCDVEPAILARNILLLTMILDEASPERVWNIFFHFYLDRESLQLLRRQCRKLVNLSRTLQSWKDGEYSSILCVCSTHTLSELRRLWIMYDETEDLPLEEKAALQTNFSSVMKSIQDRFDGRRVTTAARSAGPLWISVFVPGSDHFRRFWTTGVTFDDASHISEATLMNPVFACDASGRRFNVHYGTDPILAFHLSMTAKLPKDHVSPSDLVQMAQTQFYSWCASFRARVETPNVVIRLFAGDALIFCRALHFCAKSGSVESGLINSSWETTQVILDGGDYKPIRAPLSFNVIDTSNLSDHLGLLNILVATVPLLQPTPAAILNTNTLLTTEDTGGAPCGLAHRVCTDIPTLSLLLGLVPVSYVSGFTSHSNMHEVLCAMSPDAPRHESISWKMAPIVGSPGNAKVPQLLQVKPDELGKILCAIYLQMFSDESLAHLFGSLGQPRKKLGFSHYVRASFVALIAFVKERIRTDWNIAISHMLSLLQADTTLFTGRNYYQDLCCHLHLYRAYTVGALVDGNFGNVERGIFKNWTQIPPVVCVVLKVPRWKVKVLETISDDRIGTPIIHGEVEGRTFHNFFSSIQSYFGETIISRTDPNQLLAKEDEARWSGNSPLIVSFYVPSWILCIQPGSTTIRLSVRAGSAHCKSLYSLLGQNLHVFSADLMDETHVSIVRARPSNPQELSQISGDSAAKANFRRDSLAAPLQKSVSVLLDNTFTTRGLTARIDYLDEASRKALRDCQSSEIQFKQTSPFSMMLSLASFNTELVLPYPINGSKCKSRIARISSYVEVDVNLCGHGFQGLATNPFPLVMDGATPTAWNIHYLNLEQSPELDVTQMDWLREHLMLTPSDSEYTAIKTVPRMQQALLTRMKSIMIPMFTQMTDPIPARIFIMRTPPDLCPIVMFLNSVRLDLASHTVVADMCALALSGPILDVYGIQDIAHRIVANDTCVSLTLDDAAMAPWRQLLPALAERCRTWSHSATCSLIRNCGTLTEIDRYASPFCGCGQGRNLPQEFVEGEWKAMAPYATRIALSPFFARSYMETIGSVAREVVADALGLKNPDVCDVCRGPGTPGMMRCSVCARAKYCSKVCQKDDWKTHKAVCKKTTG
ncbi:hypothetical protein DXG03_002600 [Asterophora parasitica]|uniref:MYND-type domain-containing protein n=1 Tax=Asterophora parasitica TaxID=117018 RepID=A0A9P7G1T0_9AGAR|nr:hypothetical protein DXG03_002600 [Asterophora parasitica]